jgi:hypothetical protein
VSDTLDNPATVIWSHSNRQADFYELSTDGSEIHEALGWLLNHYTSVTLWMGLETEDGAELFLTCSPASQQSVVDRLNVVDRDDSIFDALVPLVSGE